MRTQHAIRPGTVARFKDRGVTVFIAFLRTRSWLPPDEWHSSSPYPHINLFLEEGIPPILPSQRVQLLILYLDYLFKHGHHEKNCIEALQFYFRQNFRSLDVFDDPMFRAARSSPPPAQMMEQADSREEWSRQIVTPHMLHDMYSTLWPPLISLDSLSPADIDERAAVIVGFLQYHTGQRISNFCTTRPEKYWSTTTAALVSTDGGGAPPDSTPKVPTDFRGNLLNPKLVKDPHCLRAQNVAFQFYDSGPWVTSPEVQPELGYPMAARLAFYSTKSRNSGKPEYFYLTPTPTRPATVSLLRMLWLWTAFARFGDPLDNFFSRPGMLRGPRPIGRKLLQQGSVNGVIKKFAIRSGATATGKGFSSNSFKVGGSSRNKKNLEDDGLEDELVDEGIKLYARHKSIKAAKYYVRNRVDSNRPLDSIWTNDTRDDSDRHDLMMHIQQSSSSASNGSRKVKGSRGKGGH